MKQLANSFEIVMVGCSALNETPANAPRVEMEIDVVWWQTLCISVPNVLVPGITETRAQVNKRTERERARTANARAEQIFL